MSEIDSIQKKIRDFRDDRDWMQFHNPKDMAAAISIEAAELQSLFLWKSAAECPDVLERKEEQVIEEIADIAIYLLELADNLNIDLIPAIEAKIAKNAKKYPAEQVRGSSKKYTEYLEENGDVK
jgi:dCTP diphosphatase